MSGDSFAWTPGQEHDRFNDPNRAGGWTGNSISCDAGNCSNCNGYTDRNKKIVCLHDCHKQLTLEGTIARRRD